MFLKECKYIEKKVVRGIQDSLGDFSYSCDESNEKYFFCQRKIKKFLETWQSFPLQTFSVSRL